MNLKLAISFTGLGMLVGCSGGLDYDPVTFTVDGDRIIATGVIDETALAAFDDVTTANPQAKTLVLQQIDGSVDDEANLKLARMVRDAGFNTVVPAGGLVASGGTDLFLAGVDRTLAAGACVGVHSWAADGYEATDIPRDDPEHDPYIRYFTAMGIPTAFYWYTLDAAPASGMHWMTEEEAEEFRLVPDAPELGTAAVCNAE